ncbi:MAG TPA: dienelactone hydrolase family protein [Stellaceae bacterium]|nr:dienelactone hydrolase family protein [Stellaceae bacterium]
MTLRVWACLVGIVSMLGPLAGPSAAALRYTGFGVTLASSTNGAPQAIPATILRPEGDGPFPAIVIEHDCSGLGTHSSGAPGRWAPILAGEGYVVIMPDSFAPRGFPDGVCTAKAASEGGSIAAVLPGARAVDAYAALDYLRTLPYVDGARIGIMGGSHGGSTTLAAMSVAASPLVRQARPEGPGFAAAIALYPGCGARFGGWNVERTYRDHGPVTRYIGVYKPLAPLLILIGEKDDWTPADQCQRLAQTAQEAGFPVSIKVYPGAYHAFDSSFPVRYIAERRNINKDSGKGATTGGDAAAWKDSIEQVKSFFARYLRREAKS